RRHTRFSRDWSSDVCSSDLVPVALIGVVLAGPVMELMLRGQGGEAGAQAGRSMLLLFLPQIPLYGIAVVTAGTLQAHRRFLAARSEERRVGQESRSGAPSEP